MVKQTEAGAAQRPAAAEERPAAAAATHVAAPVADEATGSPGRSSSGESSPLGGLPSNLGLSTDVDMQDVISPGPTTARAASAAAAPHSSQHHHVHAALGASPEKLFAVTTPIGTTPRGGSQPTSPESGGVEGLLAQVGFSDTGDESEDQMDGDDLAALLG